MAQGENDNEGEKIAGLTDGDNFRHVCSSCLYQKFTILPDRKSKQDQVAFSLLTWLKQKYV